MAISEEFGLDEIIMHSYTFLLSLTTIILIHNSLYSFIYFCRISQGFVINLTQS